MEGTPLNLGPYLLGGLIGVIIGWVIGFLDSNLRTSKKIKQAEESARIATREASDKIAAMEAREASLAGASVIMDDPGLMRIKNENGMLTLELDGARVDTSALHPDNRRRLIEMLNVMRPWLENKPAPAPATPPPPPPQPIPTPQTQGRPAPTNIASPASQPPPSTPARTPAPAPKKDDKPAAAPTTMVGQINAILQLRIANTKFAAQGITMIESPTGGVYVYVGLNKYEGIDSVPDEEIKAVIRAAISDWEKKYTPGLS